jgi:hypothetical protein
MTPDKNCAKYLGITAKYGSLVGQGDRGCRSAEYPGFLTDAELE